MTTAMVLSAYVPRERLAEERLAAQPNEPTYGDGVHDAMGAVAWAVHELMTADAATVRGRLVAVGASVLSPDDLAALLDEVHGRSDAAVYASAIERLAKAVL